MQMMHSVNDAQERPPPPVSRSTAWMRLIMRYWTKWHWRSRQQAWGVRRVVRRYQLRQPLARVRINVGAEQQRIDLLELTDVLQEEINVKAIEIVS